MLSVVSVSCSSSATTGTASGPGGTASNGSLATGASAGVRPKVDTSAPTTKAGFTVQPGVEVVMVTGATPGARLTLVDKGNDKLLTLKADPQGQAVWSYIPTNWMEIDPTQGAAPPTTDGRTLKKGDGFTVRDESASPNQVSDPFTVMGRDDHPPTSLYDSQTVKGVPWRIVGGAPDGVNPRDGMQYLKMRDGVTLSAMVRYPDPTVYGPGPYPTLIEYSGYSPSDPKSPQPGTMIASATGFATVGLNMRGSGCSGGVFDVFNPAQQADGYDAVEIVARQPWVKGHKVGMIGLSYAGISQLFVAATQPPSLAAITPLSVIEDPWKMSWPGGIYNQGFTKQWLTERDKSASPSGDSWISEQIKSGDQTCQKNQNLRALNIDFEKLVTSLDNRPPDADDRDLSILVKSIKVPVYLSGAWQDEQTGPRFATMLKNFTGTDKKHFVLFNGHHPDGYAPANLSRWLEFLQLYVGEQKPMVPALVRVGAPALFEDNFKVKDINFEPDRYTDIPDGPDAYPAALKRWEAEPTVLVRFEVGAGLASTPGAPYGRYQATFDTWPPKTVTPWKLYLDDKGMLAKDKPGTTGADSFRFDPEAGKVAYAQAGAYDFIAPTVKVDWADTPAGKGLAYLTPPLEQDTVIAGPGYADLWFRSDAEDANIEIVLSEVTPDGNEIRIQTGVIRASDAKVDTARSDEFLIQQTFAQADEQKLVPGKFIEVKVPIFPVAHALRKGSKLRVQINTPGRDLPLWAFDNLDFGQPDAKEIVGRGGDQASSLVLPVLPAGSVPVPADRPPCPSLRGQPCRPYHEMTNAPG